jgi:anti-sigma factor RsiW
MSTMPDCDKVLLVQAELDGELGAAEVAALAAHRAQCPVCEAAAGELMQARALMRGDLYQPAPEDVRQRIMASLAAARPSHPQPAAAAVLGVLHSWRGWWSPWWSPRLSNGASFGLGAACAAALAFLLLTPALPPGVTDQVVAGHVRALQPGHLEDVASEDRHTVKPWFDGKLDFAPPVKDLVADRFPLIGGRLDYLDGRPVAALVYQHDKHVINLFVWPGAGNTQPQSAERQGYNIVHWSQDGMNFWAVSDVEMAQLKQFAADWSKSP